MYNTVIDLIKRLQSHIVDWKIKTYKDIYGNYHISIRKEHLESELFIKASGAVSFISNEMGSTLDLNPPDEIAKFELLLQVQILYNKSIEFTRGMLVDLATLKDEMLNLKPGQVI